MTADERHKRFERWVGEYGAMVSRIASTYEARPALAEELVQESFMGLWRALPNFRQEASAKTFVARIAHNVCISHVRKAVKAKSGPLDEKMRDEGLRPDELAEKSSERRALLEAVRALPLQNRQIVSLHLEGFSHREIGDALGISEGNIAVRLTRARAQLKAAIGGRK
ncbi:MAG: sigma-70 family RNA polymerase sigma factor [Hyphomonadaceae bacterium]